MASRIKRSLARSTSVTMLMSPLSPMSMVVPTRSRNSRPASSATRIAKSNMHPSMMIDQKGNYSLSPADRTKKSRQQAAGSTQLTDIVSIAALPTLSFELPETLEQPIDIEGGGDHADDQADDEPQRRGAISTIYPPADQRRD